MGSPREDEDVVIPLRLERVGERSQELRGRSTAVVAAALVVFVAAGIGLRLLSTDNKPSRLPALILAEVTAPPRPGESAPVVTPSPRAIRSQVPLATALPALEIRGDLSPTERRLVYGDGLELLDLATGSLTHPSPPLNDLLPLGGNQLVCACVLGVPAGSDPAHPTPVIRFGRYDLTGKPLLEREVLSFDGVVAVPDQSDGFNAATALSDDRRTLYVLTAARRPPLWSVDLNLIDVETGELLDGRTIGRFPVDLDPRTPEPSPTPAPDGAPPNGVYAWATSVTAAPDGRTIMITVQAVEWRDGNGTNRVREWMVPIRDRRAGSPVRLQGQTVLPPNDWCLDAPWFLDTSVAAAACFDRHGTSGSGLYVRRVTADGQSLGTVALDGLPSSEGALAATVDRRSGVLIAWDPISHTLARVDIATGEVAYATVPDDVRPAVTAPGRSRFGAWPALVLSPDGRRAYALGSAAGTSSGVWVFDTQTLDLVDHWEPRAALNSIAVSADGRFVYATGAAGLDVNGIENGLWEASVTVYDAATGEQVRLYGAEGAGVWLTFPSWR